MAASQNNSAKSKLSYPDMTRSVHHILHPFNVPNLHTIKTKTKNAEVLVVASKRNNLDVDADETKYVVMSGDQNAGRSHSINTDNRSFERVEGFKYLGTTLTNENSIQEEIKSRLKSGNACYHSVQNLLSSSLLPKNLKMKDIKKYNVTCCFVWV